MANSITLVGNAAENPEVRYFESGSISATFRLAVTRGEMEPDTFNLELWGKQAQIAADVVRQGDLVGIIGSVHFDRWTDKARGEKRSKTVIRVDRLELLRNRSPFAN